MNAQTRATIDLMVLMMATLSGIAIVILAVMIGGGPDWSVLRLSATAIILTPAGALTWCYRDHRLMPVIAKGVLAAFVVIDIVIALGVIPHLGGATNAIASINPGAALIWGTLWLFWQVLTLLAALKRS